MKFLTSLLIIVSFSLKLPAQDGVSIGRTAPDQSAVLHISSPTNNKGVLFPNSSPVTIRDILNPSDGLFIYDTIFHRYSYRKDNIWMYLNPWDTEQINPDNTGDPNEDITYISTPYEVQVNNDVSADHFDGYGVVPIRGIIMWSGSEASIPDNFQLCDGGTKNGITTPNLVGRFIRAARSGGATGGSDASGTTSLSYIETPRYTIGTSTCQTFEFIYRATVTVPCDFPEGISDEVFTLTKPAASCTDVFFELIESIPGICSIPPDLDIESSCTQSANPNYYLTNPACRNDDVREVNAVTNTDNRPAYYELAYIMRVE